MIPITHFDDSELEALKAVASYEGRSDFFSAICDEELRREEGCLIENWYGDSKIPRVVGTMLVSSNKDFIV